MTCEGHFIQQTIPTPIQYADEGSVHLSVYEADTVRIAAYRYYRVREKFPVPTTAIVLHLTYKKDENRVLGGISNMDEVEKFFQKKIAVDMREKDDMQIWSYRSIEVDTVSKGKKIHALYETDILFSLYNDLLINMIYLIPGSCVVTVNYNLMSSPHLNSIAEQSQLFYLEISNFSVPVPSVCSDKNSNVRFHIYSDRCKEELMKQDVYVQPGMLMSYLRVAKTYTMIHKYYDESEGSYQV